MTVGTIEMFSPALGQKLTYTLLLPDYDKWPPPYRVVMQLHGRGGSHRDWLYYSNLLNYLENIPLAAVLPDGADHMWSNMYPTIPYETFLVEEIRRHVEATFPVRKGLPWAIGGNSMSGYGALRLGLKYPASFSSVYAHSSPVHTQAQMREWPNNFTQDILNDLDLYYLSERANKTNLPRLTFDCGTEDQAAIDDNRQFHAYLAKLELPHEFIEAPGVHDWVYWNSRLPLALEQHLGVFELPGKI